MPIKYKNGPETRKAILKWRCEGVHMKEIASRLNIALKTAEYHWAVIQKDTGIKDVAVLTQYALRHGIAQWQKGI